MRGLRKSHTRWRIPYNSERLFSQELLLGCSTYSITVNWVSLRGIWIILTRKIPKASVFARKIPENSEFLGQNIIIRARKPPNSTSLGPNSHKSGIPGPLHHILSWLLLRNRLKYGQFSRTANFAIFVLSGRIS